MSVRVYVGMYWCLVGIIYHKDDLGGFDRISRSKLESKAEYFSLVHAFSQHFDREEPNGQVIGLKERNAGGAILPNFNELFSKTLA